MNIVLSLLRGILVSGGRWQQEISNLTNRASITTRIFYSKWLITSWKNYEIILIKPNSNIHNY